MHRISKIAIALLLSAPCMTIGAEPPECLPDCRFHNLSRSDLRHADLTGADLRWALLYRADLGGAVLDGTDLTGAVCLA